MKTKHDVVPDLDLFWEAVQKRDSEMDGVFFYGVTTTGIYCRPSCPSRRPLRKHWRVFGDAADAERGGYRACLRCRPHRLEQADPTTQALIRVARLIRDRAEESLTLKALAAHGGISPSHLQRRFKALFGVSPRQFQADVRLHALKHALRDGQSVTAASHVAGYGSSSRVHEQVDGALGMTPSAYRAGGCGEEIHHAVKRTRMGLLMMAATARGVCFVQFGESEEALIEALQAEFPKARLQPSGARESEALALWMAALDEYMAGKAPSPELPLDLRGTAFQLEVWRFLRTVPEGRVLSYAELARSVGRPRASRAAAGACAANRVAVLVPCHRVLRSDGSLGGYRWGTDRKRVLLDRERTRNARAN